MYLIADISMYELKPSECAKCVMAHTHKKLFILLLTFTFVDILLLRNRTQYTQSTTSFLEKESIEDVR